MGTTFRQKGDILTHENDSGSDIAVDEVIVIGDSVAVALVAIADGEKGSVSVAGVHLLAKRTGQAWVQGDKLSWDVSESEFGKGIVAYAGDVIGCAYAAKDAASADATGEVLLANPGTIEP